MTVLRNYRPVRAFPVADDTGMETLEGGFGSRAAQANPCRGPPPGRFAASVGLEIINIRRLPDDFF